MQEMNSKQELDDYTNKVETDDEMTDEEAEELMKQFEDEDDSDLEFIWGIESYDNLTRHCDIHSLNDIELIYHKDTKEYTVDIETIYGFDKPDAAVNYLQNLLKAFTDWMQEQGYETEDKPGFYQSFTYTENQHFKTIEDAYMDFKLRVTGFCALHQNLEEEGRDSQ